MQRRGLSRASEEEPGAAALLLGPVPVLTDGIAAIDSGKSSMSDT